MSRPTPVIPAVALALACALGAATARCAPVPLADSTRFESLRLANGLRVVVRHIPGARYRCVSVAFGLGTLSDPAGREGLHELLAELWYFGPAGEVPARTPEEMPGLRPAGWTVVTRPRSTHFSELATAPQFAGVLHQLARRMRGIEPDSKAFKAALARVRSDMADRYARRPEQALYHRSGALADGRSAATVKRYADGAGLDGLGAREVQEILAREYVPANAALSLAGDFGGLPVAALLEREFGGIPPGLPAVAPAPGEPDTLRSDLPWPGISEPAGVVALRAPALSDTLHPSFYATTLTLGSLLTTRWQRPPPPLVSRFQYAILEDPDVARFYPPPAAEVPGVEGLIYEYATAVSEARVVHIDDGERQRIWRAVDWVLGGPVPPELQERMRTDPGALQTLCSGAALRELSGGEGFWAEYRRRFRDAAPSVAAWTERFLDPAWLVALRLVPKP